MTQAAPALLDGAAGGTAAAPLAGRTGAARAVIFCEAPGCDGPLMRLLGQLAAVLPAFGDPANVASFCGAAAADAPATAALVALVDAANQLADRTERLHVVLDAAQRGRLPRRGAPPLRAAAAVAGVAQHLAVLAGIIADGIARARIEAAAADLAFAALAEQRATVRPIDGRLAVLADLSA